MPLGLRKCASWDFWVRTCSGRKLSELLSVETYLISESGTVVLLPADAAALWHPLSFGKCKLQYLPAPQRPKGGGGLMPLLCPARACALSVSVCAGVCVGKHIRGNWYSDKYIFKVRLDMSDRQTRGLDKTF